MLNYNTATAKRNLRFDWIRCMYHVGRKMHNQKYSAQLWFGSKILPSLIHLGS